MDIKTQLQKNEDLLFPTVNKQTIKSNTVTYELFINANLTWFDGHFDDLPILPGVTQIDWVMHLSKDLCKYTNEQFSVERLKFMKPITPNASINCEISAGEHSRPSLSFKYFDDSSVYSSGRVVFIHG